MANLRPTKEAHEFLENTLARRTGIRRNVWARIAAARSITLPSLPEEADFDSEGVELARQTVLGEQDSLFEAMFTLRYERALSDDDFFPRLFKLHMERGVKLLRQDWELSGGRPEDFYVKLAENLPAFSLPHEPLIDHTGVLKSLRLDVGTIADGEEALVWSINKANNAHSAIVGTTGSGKTQLVKELLVQLTEQGQGRLPFIFFDYARGDVAGDPDFVRATNARVVDLPNRPVPLSPLPNCRSGIEINQQSHHLAKIFRDVAPHIGIVQEQRLIDAVQQCYVDSVGEPPDFYALREIVEAGGEIDSLTGVLRKLTDLRLFPSRDNKPLDIKDLLGQSWIIDLHRLQELRELVVFLILDSLKNYFSRLRDQHVDPISSARELRCILVIDEAHNFLPNDNAQVLEKCLRELRGKGVGVWLLTQNPRDLEQEHYNYSTEVNFHMCLKVLDAKPQILTNLYGVPPGEAKNWSVRLATFDREGLCRNAAVPKGFSKVVIKQFWQRKAAREPR
jgi:DNA sulfur modification protein DndE